jgi:hypothetical protein
VGIREVMVVEIRFPDHISGPPKGWRSARSREAMFRAMMDLQAGVLFLKVWKADSIGQWRNLVEARWREARAVVPRAPSSFKICVQERTAAPQ